MDWLASSNTKIKPFGGQQRTDAPVGRQHHLGLLMIRLEGISPGTHTLSKEP